MQNIKEFFARHERFLVLGHREPDGDCVASQLVLSGWLARRGRQAVPVSAGPFDRPEIASFEPKFKTCFEDALDSFSAASANVRTAVVILDCSHPDRTGLNVESIAALPSLVIDHHAAGSRYGDLALLDPRSPSTTLLVRDVMQACGNPPTAAEAELLVLGFCTDTGFFRHLDENGAAYFPALARLLSAGVSLNKIYRRIHSGRPLGQVRFLGDLLTRTESYAGGRVLLTWQSLADTSETVDTADRQAASVSGVASDVAPSPASGFRGSDDLFRHLQSVKDNEVALFIREEKPGQCSVGLRSTGAFDVSKLAQSMGGGGHVLAAGFTFDGGLEAARLRMLEVLGRYYDLSASTS